MQSDPRIVVIGLGYVGLPLAVALAPRFETIGFDIDEGRVAELRSGSDRTREVDEDDLRTSSIRLTADSEDCRAADIYIVTVPTPVDQSNRPDLSAVLAATRMIAGLIEPTRRPTVVYESTVYPGVTEELCGPEIERAGDLKRGRDFRMGYSPERINPGDKQHRLPAIRKVTSGSTPEVAELVDQLYASIITAGTYKAQSIRVAEAAKVIENTQRDLNIALVNELAIIFNRMGIDTQAVLEAAGTKWNFLPFRPGLVGGHCIGVDPYYLTHKAQAIGYHPEIILAGRRLNDGMGAYVAGQLVKALLKRRIHVDGARVLVMGLTFKENVPDIRNSRAIDLIRRLQWLGHEVDVADPFADPSEVAAEYGIELVEPDGRTYDLIVGAVAHQPYRDLTLARLVGSLNGGGTIADLKGIWRTQARAADLDYWTL